MAKKIALLVISCDKYADLWPIYFDSIFKYWPDCPLRLYLGSNYRTYDHKDITMINIGEDSDYSSNLKLMLQSVEEDYVITTVEDMFLSSPVDKEHLFSYFQEFFNNKAAYLKLLYTYPVGYDKDASKRTASLPSNVRYRMGMGTSLWDKKILLKHLVPGMTAWEMERGGEFGKNIPAEDVYAINFHFSGKVPFTYQHGVIKGKWIRNAIPWLRKEGYENKIPNRVTMSFFSTVYLSLFIILMAFFRKINFKWKP